MSAAQNPGSINPEDVFGGESYEEFLEGPKSQVEFAGDMHSNDPQHDSDIVDYTNALMDKYDPEDDLEGIILTGDLATNLGANANIEEMMEENPRAVEQQAEEYLSTIMRSREALEQVEDYFDHEIDIVIKEGNHTTTRGAHSDQADLFSDAVEEVASGKMQGFQDYDGSFDEFVFEDSDSVDLVNYDAKKIGDTTYVFGGAGWKNEIDPMVLEHGIEMLYDDDDFQTKKEEWTSLLDKDSRTGEIARKLGPIGTAADKAYDFYKSMTADTEEFIPEDKMTEEHKAYEDGLEKLEQAYDKASELGGENTVFVSHQGPNSHLEDEYTIDEFDKAPVPQGSVAEAKFLEDKEFDGILIGHHHGGKKTEFDDTPLLNLGAGQTTPGAPENITDSPVYEPGDTPNFRLISKLDQIEEQGFDEYYAEMEDEFDSILQEAEDNGAGEEVRQHLNDRKDRLDTERELMEQLSDFRDQNDSVEAPSPETPGTDYGPQQATA